MNQPDKQALAEAKALLNCIRVTQDPTEQNRLWNRYYRLSDKVFPEVAALHMRYKSLTGGERQRFKNEYMELVRRLWAATDPNAAYDIPFVAAPSSSPAPVQASAPRRAPARKPSHRRNSFNSAALLLIAGVVGIAGSAIWWKTLADGPVVVETSANDESPESSESRGGADVQAPTTAIALVEPMPLPDVVDEAPPVAEFEAELARAIVPDFKAVPPELQGLGDQVVADGKTYSDVYVIESDAQYFIRLPAEGAVETVSKSEAEVSLGGDPSHRQALLALWKENRAEIDRVAAEREKGLQVRLAAHHKAREAAREARAVAQEAERWRVKGEEWRVLTADQRVAARMRAYSNWRAVQADLASVEELYYRIVKGYEIIGITDSRANRLNSAYSGWARERGPNFEIEDALISYQWGREEIVNEIATWEREYYRLLEHVNSVYPGYEARVEEIKRLDDSLPPEVFRAEATIDWDKAPAGEGEPAEGGNGGVGTGFIVADGYVMTCAHVVRRGSNIRATSKDGKEHMATVVTMDTANDWALLKVDGLQGVPIPVAEGKPNVGATIYCLGYPLGGIKDSADPIVGSGNIAALQRLDGDQRFMQITAPVNPGNSGGPVLDQFGRWVGIVSQKLNDQKTLDAAQTVAQGVNFAVKATFIQPILDPRAGVRLTSFTGDATTPMSLEKIAASVGPSIVRIDVN